MNQNKDHGSGLSRLVRISTIAGLVACFGCSEQDAIEPRTPLSTVKDLLSLHGMLGRQSHERDAKARDNPIAAERLTDLFTDYGTRERFIDDLYVGFVVGALSKFQDELVVTNNGAQTIVAAGRVRIVLKVSERGYRIDLGASVPGEIKTRAATEYRRFQSMRRLGV